MEAFFVSSLVVAISEFGDKTQLLAVLLAVRFRMPVTIILGILAATILNHAAAAFAGAWVATAIDPQIMRWALAALFFGVAIWALVPDKLDEGEVRIVSRAGAFAATAIAFFLAEIGDKTQIATVALAIRFADIVPVVIGTTAGMLIADAPAVLLAERFATRLNLAWVRYAAAVCFGAMGVVTAMSSAL